MADPADLDQALVCWECGTPLVLRADGADKPCGHSGPIVVSRADYLRRKGPRMADTAPKDHAMPEIPDFEQIAREAVMTFYDTTPRHSAAEVEAVANIARRLRQVWNARGAADAQAAAEKLATLTGGWVAEDPYRKLVFAAIAALNR